LDGKVATEVWDARCYPLTIWQLLHTNAFWQALIWLAAYTYILGMGFQYAWKQSCVYKVSGCYDDRFWESNPWIYQYLPG